VLGHNWLERERGRERENGRKRGYVGKKRERTKEKKIEISVQGEEVLQQRCDSPQ
jgi:hypothetical protein